MAVQIRERFKRMFKRGKSSEVVKREERGREAVVNELRRGYGQLVDTMQSVQAHMEHQSKRSDRIMEVVEALPEVLRSIPESARQQNKTLESLAESLRVQNQSTGELTHALAGLAEATRRQEQTLTGMHDRLNDTVSRGEETQQSMLGGIRQMTGAIEGVTRDQQAGRSAIAQVADQSRRQQKQMMAMNGVSWALAVLALGVSGWVAVKLVDGGPTAIAGRDVAGAVNEAAPPPAEAPTESADQLAQAKAEKEDPAPAEPSGEQAPAEAAPADAEEAAATDPAEADDQAQRETGTNAEPVTEAQVLRLTELAPED